MPIDRRLRSQRFVPVVSDGIHADGMVHASSRGERVSSGIGAAARPNGRGMVDVGSRKDWTDHTTPGQIVQQMAYQFEGCYYHSCMCTRQEVNAVNVMSQRFPETHATTTYMQYFVMVVEVSVERHYT